jgi:glutamate synthase domain-containing protein 2/glutamate synthase domain-containing protein 1/glutamate synthase domain-containing protein 3
MRHVSLPEAHGLYDPRFEHDSCGVGFVCNIKGKESSRIVREGLEVLNRLAHRGATGADPKTGDGAGILIQIPHEFFVKACRTEKINLPDRGNYGTGLIFLPTDPKERDFCKTLFTKIINEEAAGLLGWRRVPVDNSNIGVTARETEPVIEQIFIQNFSKSKDLLNFERKLYVTRKRVENIVRPSGLKQKAFFYVTNLSCRTFSYKGLLMPHQVGNFFIDLKDESMKSAISLVHSRYSTNTFPTWNLSQPFRFLSHNGEINTLRGNINWMRARESLLASKLFTKNIKKLCPIIVPGGSDSASLDNMFELLTLSGRSLAHAMMMLIPAAWEQDNAMSDKLKAFYKYHSCITEPWDGPAAIAFTDGKRIGACLDRNGLRPARYIVTKDDFAVMASEVGVLDIPSKNIVKSGRLEPGKIFFIDTELGRIIDDGELKDQLASRSPYGAWVKENMVELGALPKPKKTGKKVSDIARCLKAFGYTREDMKILIRPMSEKGVEPIGSMGNDTPHAVLSPRPQLLYSYFKQLFAQVTNPAIDPIREELVMSLGSYIGPGVNLLDETAAHCRRVEIKTPILTNEELAKIREVKLKGFKTKVISTLFDAASEKDFKKTLGDICIKSAEAIRQGYKFVILSDRGVNKKNCALPALLAVGTIHQYLVKRSLRTQIGIIVASAEPREVHHFALLFGYGADCVNPYLAYEAVRKLIADGDLDMGFDKARDNYITAINKGILKILSKIGISTLQSYRGAQIFEVLGLNADVIEKSFAGTASRIGGVGFDVIYKEAVDRHQEAYSNLGVLHLATGGLYQWQRDGEFHLWNPDTIAALQDAAKFNDNQRYREFAALINDQSRNPCTLRSMLKFKPCTPIPVEQVEPAESIFKRFATGAMSFGSISRGAHETLAIAMNRLGAKSNTGEGGEDPARFLPMPNGDSVRSAIKQVASGRFGVTTNYLVNADELQIKIAQGAKPGEGGQLPGHKVSGIIARTRYTTPGVTLISPPPHHDIYSIEDLAQLIFDLKNVNPRARISVKLVSEVGVGTVAAGVAKGHADMILISGGDGGTGASPLSSIKHAGLPWELGLSEAHQTLVLNNLRSRVRLQTDGQMRTGRDVAIAALLGAEEFGFCTATLIISGCVMLRHCHLNNCSVGVATQDEMLENRFKGRPEYVVNYFNFIAEELRQIMASLGVRNLDDMIGRTDLLERDPVVSSPKADNIDFSKILYKPAVPKNVMTHCTQKQDHGIDNILDIRLMKLAERAINNAEPIKIELDIKNINRATGAMLSGEVCHAHGEEGLPTDTINCKFNGMAGQSFGAFLAKGITFELEGMANDYVGKGISGGMIIIYPDKASQYTPEENIIIGNTAFYGAINGRAYIRGMAGERFCIRNSGLYAVVEGVGDHGCEYMTGGRVVVLGKTGRNFAAGMSGGIAYIYDPDKEFEAKYNKEMVRIERVTEKDEPTINDLLVNHFKYTGSSVAGKILANFKANMKKFVKVMPLEYKRILDNTGVAADKESQEVSDG